MKDRILIFLVLMSAYSYTQINTYDPNFNRRDSIQQFAEREKTDSTKTVYLPKDLDYRYWTESLDTLAIDSSLSLTNYYNQNYTHRDSYGYMLMPNIGQGANELIYHADFSVVPKMGFMGKRFNYRKVEDIKYYDVRTPVTEFNYQSGYEEGQILETTFTHSINKTLNYSFTYRGLRSLGRYKDQLASDRAIIATLNYRSRKGRYRFWTHYASQNIDNEESAGIREVEEFENVDQNYTDRKTFTANLQGASSELDSRRFHFAQQYGLLKGIRKEDLAYRPVTLQHKFTYEKQKYLYKESEVNTFFDSDVITGKDRSALSEYTLLKNELSAIGNINDKLRLEAGISYDQFTYGYDSILVTNLINIPDKIEGSLISAIGKLNFNWSDRLHLETDAQYALGGEYSNSYQLNSNLDFRLMDDVLLNGGINIASTSPNLNVVLNQSFYSDYNYNNNFDKINSQQIHLGLRSNKYLNVKANFHNINNYVFIDNTERPKQYTGSLNLFNVTVNKTFRYRKLSLENTFTYQKVTHGEEILPLPNFVTRNTLYYQSRVFKDKAEIQTGISLYYFDQFKSRAYFP
ncbi:MAG: putative porin, partial [Flavobacteriales bacterium]